MAVFLQEWARASRRGKHHRWRAAYQLLLLVEVFFLVVAWADQLFLPTGNDPVYRAVAQASWRYFQLVTWQHFAVILLLTPGLMAGTVCDEKANGTLPLLLTTQLSSWDIVIGKWLGQLSQVLVVAMSAMPLIVLLGVHSGVAPANLALLLVETVLLATALAAGTLLTSVWSRKSTRAVLFLYGFLGLTWLVLDLADLHHELLECLLQPVLPSEFRGSSRGWLILSSASSAFTAVCLLAATWWLRPAVAADLAGASPGKGRRLFARPEPNDKPLRWKERYVGELGFLRFFARVPLWIRLGMVAVLGLWQEIDSDPANPVLQGMVLLFVVSGLVGIRCSGAVTGEREKETWTSLLLTPLGPRELLRGKLWGIIDSIRPYMLAYLVPVLLVSLRHGELGRPFLTLWFWLCTWGAVYFMAANGIHCSVRSVSSWSSLIATITSAAWSTLPFFFVAWGVAFAASMGFLFLCTLSDLFPAPSAWLFGVTVAAVMPAALVLLLFSTTEQLLEEAEAHLNRKDRVRQRIGPARVVESAPVV